MRRYSLYLGLRTDGQAALKEAEMKNSSLNAVKLLIYAMTKSQEMPRVEDKKKKISYTVFGGAAILLVMIPCCVVVGLVAYTMTQALIEAGGHEQGMLFIVEFMSLCSMLFGFHVLLDQLYFTSDLNHLLALPVKPSSIAAAKFYTVFLEESVMEFMILLSGFIGYLLAGSFTVSRVVFMLVGIFVLPLQPLAYCGILSLIIMTLLKRVGNRKLISRIILIVTLLLMGGLLLSFTGLKGISMETYINILLTGDNISLKFMGAAFFTCPLIMSAMAGNNWLYFVLFILSSAAFVGVYLLLAGVLYKKSLLKAMSQGTAKREKAKNKVRTRMDSPFMACMKKELRILFRTQAFFANCIAVNFLWPGFLLVIYILQSGNGFLAQFIRVYKSGRVLADVIVLLIVAGLSMMVTGANSIASGAFTREGIHLDFMKYIPVSYRVQIRAKALVSIIISFAGCLCNLFLLNAVLSFGIFGFLYFALISFCCVVIITYLGIAMDSGNPKLIWEDELNALRGNMNVFSNMAMAIVVTMLLCGLGWCLYLIPVLSTVAIYMIYQVLLIVAAFVMYLRGRALAEKNIKKMLG